MGATVLLGAGSIARAQETVVELPPPEKTFVLTPGETKSLRVARSFKSIHIADPNVVDAFARSDRDVLLVPKARGVTNVMFYDDKDDRIANISVVVEPDVFESTQETIHLALGEVTRVNATRPFQTLRVANPRIVGAVSEADNKVVELTPKADGATNIDFLDDRGVRVGSFNVEVDSEKRNNFPGQMTMHNQKVLTSETVYKCSPTGCQFVREHVAETQALAGGRTEHTLSQTLDQTFTNAPAASGTPSAVVPGSVAPGGAPQGKGE